jgi:protein-S-isoprenylcysteine O-methyltransferase Ste14
MISGVILMLVGEGLVLRSTPHLLWAGIFFIINAIYIPLLEEPRLRSRFGADYEEYRKAVPRLVPRLRPWRPNG